jgi:hypothetical protein
MAFVSIATADIAAGKPVDNDLMTQFKDNFDALNASAAGALYYNIPNGDMELTDGTFPANWDATTYPSGTAGIETTSPIGGSQSMKFVHPGGAGNGGGYADSDYIPCGAGSSFKLDFLTSTTAATMKNQVIIRWFTAAKVYISATTIYDSISNPTTATSFSGIGVPPSTARFYKVRLVGGESSVDVAGTTLFDLVTVSSNRSRVFSASSVTSLEITELPYSRDIEVTVAGASAASGLLALQFSSDNGSTWVTSSSYFYAAPGSSDTTAGTHLVVGNFTNTEASIVFNITGLGLSAYTAVTSKGIDRLTTPGVTAVDYSGIINATTAYNAFRFINSTGGTFSITEVTVKVNA